MSSLPVIGITADRSMMGAHASHTVAEKYITAAMGGSQAFAVLLPALGGGRQSITSTLSLVDGLLFTGSYSNVEPARYGGPPSAPGTLHDPARDATTLPLIRAAIEAGVPVLAICRGFQEMNVAFGGSLHQSVHTTGSFADHRENKDNPLDVQYAHAHAVRLVPGGKLQQLLQAGQAMVNSLHGQGVDRIGDGLVVEALAPDGLVEALSVAGSPAFALGVQWHPEWKYAQDKLSTALFQAFGDACRQRMLARAGQQAFEPIG